MYRLLAIAKYEDRYVIPQAPRRGTRLRRRPPGGLRHHCAGSGVHQEVGVRHAQLLSALLLYPGTELADALDELEQAADGDGRIERFLGWVARTPLGELRQTYVETFDFDRRAGLHLTYHILGDRRQRGLELVRLKRRYAAAGFPLSGGELPDYLPVMLEFAPLVPAEGEAMLNELRARSSSSAPDSTTRQPLRGPARCARRRPAEADAGAGRCSTPDRRGGATGGAGRPGAVRRGSDAVSRGDFFLWIAFPYLCVAVFAAGHVWRYRRDHYGWTARSTQLMERRLLMVGSLLFHFGILAAIGGHVLGILVPRSWTSAIGISEGVYHRIAVVAGGAAGAAVVAGFAILVYRRMRIGRVRATTTRSDLVLYPVLAAVIVLGVLATFWGSAADHYHYRETVSPWFRGIFGFRPDGSLMADAPFLFQAHAVSSWLLLGIWPFTRLVHAWSVPVAYVARAPILYRSRARPVAPSRAAPDSAAP